ncbi:hypothetical protein UlMin_009675 [Ulmus minor]
MGEISGSKDQVQEGDHVIDIVEAIKLKMEDKSAQVFISKVPEAIRSKHETAFTPTEVSIGPLHHGNVSSETEEQKWRYLSELLNRDPNLEETLESLVKALRKSERRIRNCYEEKSKLPSDDFVQMMLLDSCFIIELLLKFSVKGLRYRNDKIFTTKGMLFDLRRDLILLENQIPFFVLQQVFHIIPIPPQCTHSLNDLAARFFNYMIPGDLEFLKERFNQKGYHLLDLIWRSIVPTHPREVVLQNSPPKSLDSATELRKAGIWFKKGRSHEFLLEVKFSNGVLAIPHLKIHQCTEELLVNLIALEQSHIDKTQQVTSYAHLMRCLISSGEDVKLLRRRRILGYSKDKDKEEKVAKMFQKLSEKKENFEVKDSYYTRLFEKVDEYKTNSLYAKWQKMKRGYSKTSLSVVVFVVAILLLVLTFVGVFFVALSFFLHHSLGNI